MNDDTHNPLGEGDVHYAACLYAAKGFRVFPCLPLKKEPAIKAWQIHATIEQKIINGWFGEFPDRNLAVACGPQPNGINLLVIDIDPRHGGLETWRELIRTHDVNEVRGTACHTTPNGGWHLFFDAPPGFRNTRNRLGPGIDTRCEGGYVVVPPSRLWCADDSIKNNYLPREEAALWSV